MPTEIDPRQNPKRNVDEISYMRVYDQTCLTRQKGRIFVSFSREST